MNFRSDGDEPAVHAMVQPIRSTQPSRPDKHFSGQANTLSTDHLRSADQLLSSDEPLSISARLQIDASLGSCVASSVLTATWMVLFPGEVARPCVPP